MNKPYFAKYLPVERGYQRIVKDKNGHLIDFEQEVKLFLCSKDFDFPCDIYCFGEKTWRKNCQSTTCPECVKIIGEISPEATWVKENDEFDEKDVKFTTPFLYRKNWKEIYRVGKEKETGREQQVRPYAPSFNIKRWEVLNPQLEDYIVQIKCRCCNKFV